MSKILWLGPERPNIHSFLISEGEEVHYYEEPLVLDSPVISNTDLIVSYGYRHIIKKDLSSKFRQKIINLHISYLPWNRGADPNFWSIFQDTPKGVSIHYIDEGIDTGDIIVQKEVNLELSGTLRSSYEQLSEEIESLFIKNWSNIKYQKIKACSQTQKNGSFHYKKDKKAYDYMLHNGWETPILDILGKYKSLM